MLSYLAAGQLAAWEKLADGWDMQIDGEVLRCGECDKGVLLLSDPHGVSFTWDHAQRLALIVLHLRNFHPDLDPDGHQQAL